MQQTRRMELMVGSFVLLGVLAILFILFQVAHVSSLTAKETYRLEASFDNIGTLKPRSPVKVGGVVIGRVDSIDLDPERFIPVVTMDIDTRFSEFPDNSSAEILTAGLIGEQYISIVPGFALDDTEMLKDGDRIQDTKSAIVLENLIGQFLFSVSGDNASDDGSATN
ncbi:MAG: outer membrane lipid asymmetry maintenance protein MlaD [Vibrio sp.]